VATAPPDSRDTCAIRANLSFLRGGQGRYLNNVFSNVQNGVN